MLYSSYRVALWAIGALFASSSPALASHADSTWRRHTIDQSSRGADGTRLADANGDGLLDIATGWEQGGITRVYLHPGYANAKRPWPAVTVGGAANVEDAVLVDIDGDGAMDVVSSCEGGNQVMLVHWAPEDPQYLNPKAWKTEAIPASKNRFRWMFVCPMDVDGDGQIDLIAGGKGAQSELGWWKLPKDPRQVEKWEWNTLRKPLGWVMSIESVDINGDGNLDILFTDRKGKRSGCFWLEHPGVNVSDRWREHAITAQGREPMFLNRCDLDGDDFQEIILSVRPQAILICTANKLGEDKPVSSSQAEGWSVHEIAIPTTFGSAKDAAAADLDGDGRAEIVFTTERASNGKLGIGCITDPFGDRPQFSSISGVDGIKHDLVRLVDLDGDGDLDVLTCEESKNLGVIWYENPSHSP